jgi:Rhodopirellula transposase DDE domain
MDPVTRGDPESPLRWICKSAATLARELTRRKRKVSENTVRRLLIAAGYSLQSYCNTREGAVHPEWNKIEDRMFSYITQNRRGRPLVSHEVVINLIANRATQQGLIVDTELDISSYHTGIKGNDEELALVNLIPEKFHGDWNYNIAPSRRKN